MSTTASPSPAPAGAPPASRGDLRGSPSGERLSPTHNDLPVASRRDAVQLLNARLADCLALYSQALQAHWNVKGMSFASLHLLFEQVADDVSECMDLVAERIVQLGGIAEGTVAVVAARATLSPYPLSITRGEDHAMAIAAALAVVTRAMRAGIAELETRHDAVSVDILTEVTRRLDRRLWMVEAHGA